MPGPRKRGLSHSPTGWRRLRTAPEMSESSGFQHGSQSAYIARQRVARRPARGQQEALPTMESSEGSRYAGPAVHDCAGDPETSRPPDLALVGDAGTTSLSIEMQKSESGDTAGQPAGNADEATGWRPHHESFLCDVVQSPVVTPGRASASRRSRQSTSATRRPATAILDLRRALDRDASLGDEGILIKTGWAMACMSFGDLVHRPIPRTVLSTPRSV